MSNELYRQAKLRTASNALDSAIQALEELISDYDLDGRVYSASHPRQGHASSLRQIKTINQALSRGRV